MKRLLLIALLSASTTANAALGTLPYKYQITSRTTFGIGWDVLITVLDGTNTSRGMCHIGIDPSQSWTDIRTQFTECVLSQMNADAGSMDNLLTALTGKTITVSQ